MIFSYYSLAGSQNDMGFNITFLRLPKLQNMSLKRPFFTHMPGTG